jgi:hypothetical protein
MPSTAKQAETTAYEAFQAIPITRVHGWPMQSNYKTLKSDASALASKVKDITYAWSKSKTDDYKLLGGILAVNKSYKLTGISTYTIPKESVLYNHPSTTQCPSTTLNSRSRIGTSFPLHGSSGNVSSEGLSIASVMPLTDSTIPS